MIVDTTRSLVLRHIVHEDRAVGVILGHEFATEAIRVHDWTAGSLRP